MDSIVNISTTATRDVTNDVLAITLIASASGVDANEVQRDLRKDVNDALLLVAPLKKDDEVEVSTDYFNVQPRYDNKRVKVVGYIGQAAITIKGTDTTTISKLAVQIKSMVISGTANSVSRKLRESLESELIAEAIANFTAKADTVTKLFGHTSWSVGGLNVQAQDDHRYGRVAAGSSYKMMALSAAAAPEEVQDVESGKSSVTASVSGSIVLAAKT